MRCPSVPEFQREATPPHPSPSTLPTIVRNGRNAQETPGDGTGRDARLRIGAGDPISLQSRTLAPESVLFLRRRARRSIATTASPPSTRLLRVGSGFTWHAQPGRELGCTSTLASLLETAAASGADTPAPLEPAEPLSETLSELAPALLSEPLELTVAPASVRAPRPQLSGPGAVSVVPSIQVGAAPVPP